MSVFKYWTIFSIGVAAGAARADRPLDLAVVIDRPLLGHLQRLGLALRESQECLAHRPIPCAEHVDEMLCRAITEVEGPPRNGDRCRSLRKQGLQMLLKSPERRGSEAGRRQRVLAQGLEQLPDEPFRCPIGQTDASTPATHPCQLGCCLGMIR